MVIGILHEPARDKYVPYRITQRAVGGEQFHDKEWLRTYEHSNCCVQGLNWNRVKPETPRPRFSAPNLGHPPRFERTATGTRHSMLIFLVVEHCAGGLFKLGFKSSCFFYGLT
jgi:hypothetical protein